MDYGSPLVELSDPAGLWGYQQLTPQEQTFYISLRNAAGAYFTGHIPAEISMDSLDRVLEAIGADNPEIFWFDGSLTYFTAPEDADNVTGVELLYEEQKEDIPRIQAQIDTYVSGCMASPEMVAAESDFQRLLAVYNYLVERTEYDLSYSDEQSVVSLMAEGRAVCQGYAESFALIMHRLGFPCAVIGGLSSQDWVLSDDGHAWNCVMLEGNWYNVDVTWGDPIYDADADPTAPANGYILVNDELFDRDHTDFNKLGSPVCTAMDYNYYNYYYLLCSTWDEAYFRQAIEIQRDMGLPWAEIRYDNYDAYYAAEAALFEGDLLGDICVELNIGQSDGDYLSWSYVNDDVTGVIALKLIY